MEILIFYLIGYILCGVCLHFAGFVDDNCSKKLYIYKLCKYSIFSWMGVVFIVALAIVFWCCELDEKITEFLNK